MSDAQPPLMTLWISGQMDWLCVACLKSALRCGHRVCVFTYGDVPNLPDGVDHDDARDVVPEAEIFRFDGVRQPELKGSYAPFSDAFRYRALAQERGVWIDADMYFLHPIDLSRPIVLGWEHPQTALSKGKRHRGHVGNGIIRLPARSDVVSDLVELTSPPYRMPPWVSPAVRREVHAKLAGRPFFPGAVTYATIGPVALTYFTDRHGLLSEVQDHEAFYPVSFRDIRRFALADGRFRSDLSSRTRAIHLWNSAFMRAFSGALPKGSFAEKLREESLDG